MALKSSIILIFIVHVYFVLFSSRLYCTLVNNNNLIEMLKKRKMIYLSEKKLMLLNQRDRSYLNQSNCTIILYAKNNENIGFLSHWIQVYIFLKKNYERLILYSLCGFILGILLSMIVLIVRLYLKQRYLQKVIHFYKYNSQQTPQNIFMDELSAVDSIIELNGVVSVSSSRDIAAENVYDNSPPEVIVTTV